MATTAFVPCAAAFKAGIVNTHVQWLGYHLQDLFNKGRGPSTVKPAEKALAAPVWGVTKSAGHDLVPAALTEDLNDEYCRICWQGVKHF